MNKKVVFGLVIVLVVAVAGYFAWRSGPEVMDDGVPVMDAGEPMMDEVEPMTDEGDQMMDEDKDAVMMNDGEAAPAFSLMSLKGEQVSLEALKGDKVYVKYWASWCSICLAGMEELDELAAEAADFKVYTIVAPDINGEQSKEDFIKWFSSLGYENVEVLFDETGDTQKAYGIRAFPTSAYIGSDGVLVKVAPGHVSSEMVKSFFESIN